MKINLETMGKFFFIAGTVIWIAVIVMWLDMKKDVKVIESSCCPRDISVVTSDGLILKELEDYMCNCPYDGKVNVKMTAEQLSRGVSIRYE
jgi:hypothetical protein